MVLGTKKVSAGFPSLHFYSAAIAVTAFRALGIYPGKIGTPRIRTRVGGFVASMLGTVTARPIQKVHRSTSPQIPLTFKTCEQRASQLLQRA